MDNFEKFVDNSAELYWKPKNPANGSDEQITESLEEICKFFNFIIGKKKTKKINYEEIKQYYNVYVYQELPYPPCTKNKKWYNLQKR